MLIIMWMSNQQLVNVTVESQCYKSFSMYCIYIK